ncbi:hypothetical protein B0H13DRAFT_1957404 [Mycena leptocephala]|nr:hypothetical protein B0H13DRAFT_1957404 [Mycena leptocephala]
MSSANKAVSEAVLDCIASPHFQPPALPSVDAADWNQLLSADSPTPLNPILPHDALYTKGIEILDFALFLLLSDDLRDQPTGFLQTVRQSVSAPSVLKEIMRKIDKDLLQGGVEHVDSGFRSLVGHVWESVGRNMTTIVDWLKMVFGPLLEVATIAYKASVTQTRKVRAERLATTEDKRETKRKASAVLFLANLRDIQLGGVDVDYDVSDTSREVILYSPPPIPSFGSYDLSPLDPAVLLRGMSSLQSKQGDSRAHELGIFNLEFGMPSFLEKCPHDEAHMAARQALLLPPLESTQASATVERPLSSSFVNKNLGKHHLPLMQENVKNKVELEILWKEIVQDPEDAAENTAGPRKNLATPEPASERRGERRSPLAPSNI